MAIIRKTMILPKVILLEFETQEELASALVRFQEHYESPEFKGRVFSIKEFEDWYTKKKGSFIYYSEWDGFNFPSNALNLFYEGKFNPLSEPEKQILNLLKDEGDNYYVIGVDRESNDPLILKHEIAHGLFYAFPEYRKKSLEIVRNPLLDDFKKEMILHLMTHSEYVDDELQANVLSPYEEIKIMAPEAIKNQLEELFWSYYRLGSGLMKLQGLMYKTEQTIEMK